MIRGAGSPCDRTESATSVHSAATAWRVQREEASIGRVTSTQARTHRIASDRRGGHPVPIASMIIEASIPIGSRPRRTPAVSIIAKPGCLGSVDVTIQLEGLASRLESPARQSRPAIRPASRARACSCWTVSPPRDRTSSIVDPASRSRTSSPSGGEPGADLVTRANGSAVGIPASRSSSAPRHWRSSRDNPSQDRKPRTIPRRRCDLITTARPAIDVETTRESPSRLRVSHESKSRPANPRHHSSRFRPGARRWTVTWVGVDTPVSVPARTPGCGVGVAGATLWLHNSPEPTPHVGP